MKNYKKNIKGITLIILVITIILLLILSALVINIILGQNGLINKTKYAKNVYENGQQMENEELNKVYGQLLVASDGTINNISVDTLKELIKKEIKAELENTVVASNSIGSILAQMGEKPPEGYLICDGKEHNIKDYPELSDYIKGQFGKYNYWGGDGTNTFAVPDLRGEFLRGTGTASRNTGSGSKVGVHQDATSETMHSSSAGLGSPRITVSDYLSNHDKILATNLKSVKWGATNLGVDNTGYTYTARPTNTSVLYCIKY